MNRSMPESDLAFLRAFEACTFPAASFTHREHVHLAWIYLTHAPLPEAMGRFADSLKRFAQSLGKNELFHETVTYAYLLLISERLNRFPSSSWLEFAERNDDLYDRSPSILERYYFPETLSSELARRAFVFPDRIAAESFAET